MEKLIRKRNKFLNKLENTINEYEQLECYVDSIDFDDLYGRNRYSQKFQKLRKDIKRMRQILDELDERIRTKDCNPDPCFYCGEEIPTGTKHFKYINKKYKKFCSRGCMLLFRQSYFQ